MFSITFEFQAAQEEMAVSLKKMQDWCRIGGRVQLGCYLQTISWSDGVGEREVYADMNVFVHEADLLGTRMAETAICWRSSCLFKDDQSAANLHCAE